MNEMKIILIATIAGMVLVLVSLLLPDHGIWTKKSAEQLNLARENVNRLGGGGHVHPTEEEMLHEEPKVVDPAELEAAQKELDRLLAKLKATSTSGRPLKFILRWLGILSLVVAVGFFAVVKSRN